jgi:UPF0755 protein
MNNDIRPTLRPQQNTEQPPIADLPVIEPIPSSGAPRPKKTWKKKLLFILVGVISVALITIVCGLVWYTTQLGAVSPGSTEKVRVTIQPGSGLVAIGNQLKEHHLIRSTTAFTLYVRFNGVASKLQSGGYRLSKGDDVASIVDHLTNGKTDTFSITFVPGATLEKHRKTLIKAGYSAASVDAALSAQYSGSLFKAKPTAQDIEGLIYPETYQFGDDATPKQIIQRTLDQFQTIITKQGLEKSFQKRGLSLYKGITLASVIEREAGTAADMPQISQVFQLRLHKNMPLGSDVTYQYIADKTGVTRDPNLDSPYNTRKVTGLPPGPIGSPSLAALESVAQPASGDYLYFISGDNDKMYFAHTNEEHEQNIRDHCQKKCLII